MGNSLLDQLKKAGVVDDARSNKVKREQHKQKKLEQHQAPKKRAAPPQQPSSLSEKQLHDRELNRQRDAMVAERGLKAQVKQLVESHAIAEEGDIEFHFSDGGRVRHLYVTPQRQRLLGQGQAAIVRNATGYALVMADVADKILQRDASQVVFYNQASEAPVDGDDPYAEFVVPDDLIW